MEHFWAAFDRKLRMAEIGLNRYIAGSMISRDLTAKRGDTIHVTVDATDDDELPISRYQRVIVTVAAEEE